jgi:transcriptional regulator with XRE-family HTH domain
VIFLGLEKLNDFKKKSGMTSEQLSEKSGVPLGTLSKILAGITKDPKLETLKALCRTLGCTLDDLDDRPEDESDKELKEFTELFRELDDETRHYIIGLMKKTID